MSRSKEGAWPRNQICKGRLHWRRDGLGTGTACRTEMSPMNDPVARGSWRRNTMESHLRNDNVALRERLPCCSITITKQNIVAIASRPNSKSWPLLRNLSKFQKCSVQGMTNKSTTMNRRPPRLPATHRLDMPSTRFNLGMDAFFIVSPCSLNSTPWGYPMSASLALPTNARGCQDRS